MIYMTIGVVTVTLAIYAMISISIGSMTKEKKTAWFAIVVLIPLIGPILYYALKNKR